MIEKKLNEVYQRRDMILHQILLMLLDAVTIFISMFGALWIRFEFRFDQIEPVFITTVLQSAGWNILISVFIYYRCRLYTSLWRFASIAELCYILVAVSISTVLQYGIMVLFGLPIPRSYPFLYFLLITFLTVGCRFSYRFLRIMIRRSVSFRSEEPVNTMIIGAGAAGFMIVREMKNSKHLNRRIPCIIDDDPAKQKTYLQGVPIVGTRNDIIAAAEKYEIEEIVIAIPTLSGEEQKKLLDICQQTACRIKILPGIYQMVNEEVDVSMLREVDIDDLLGREPVQLKMDSIMDWIRGKVILVTGGGGSIGSELCRQIALHEPKQLIIVDIYENNAYEIQGELLHNYPGLNLKVLIASVRNETRIDEIFREYHPELVFHAAAHKHVPLMEDSPNEAIKNNVLGTWNVANAANKYKARKMVLISTDKAVRPTNIMGASKRICEMIIQSFSQISQTEYAAVRFGNVLGSNGSVVPLFKKQIEQGGPVTVTDPDIIRYFMTIPEAVNLVLQCGVLARGGEIFILDMGEPVKILDLANKMIRLSGHVPGKDIEIKFTGLRPGEKLYEELLINEKNLKKTTNKRIFVVQMEPLDVESTWKSIRQLIHNAFDEADDIREQVRLLVPEYVRTDNQTTK